MVFFIFHSTGFTDHDWILVFYYSTFSSLSEILLLIFYHFLDFYFTISLSAYAIFTFFIVQKSLALYVSYLI